MLNVSVALVVAVANGKTSVEDGYDDNEGNIETDNITDEDKDGVDNMEDEDDTEGSEILTDDDVIVFESINNLVIIKMCA